MNIVVTGGAGFIGSNFIFHMLEAHPDYRIICLDKLTYAGNLSTLKSVMDKPNFRFVKLDICDRAGVYKLFEEEKPDIIVNFAAESHVDRSIEDPSVFLQTNIIGTSVLMDACRKYGIKRYHQVSTDEVYGDLPLDRPDLFFTEETPIHTSSPYSSSKAGADLLVMAYHRTFGLPATISCFALRHSAELMQSLYDYTDAVYSEYQLSGIEPILTARAETVDFGQDVYDMADLKSLVTNLRTVQSEAVLTAMDKMILCNKSYALDTSSGMSIWFFDHHPEDGINLISKMFTPIGIDKNYIRQMSEMSAAAYSAKAAG